MAKFSLRKVETQARLSVVFSLLGLLLLPVLAWSVFKNVDMELMVIRYGNKTRELTIYVVGAAIMALSAIGFGMGYSSADQRRNDKPQLSWLAFFLGALGLCAAIIMVAIFYLRREFIG